MKPITHFQGIVRRGTRLVLGLTLLAASLAVGNAQVLAAPAQAPAAAGLVAGTSCSPACALHAVTGTMPATSLPGAPAAGVPIWGYNTSNASVSAPGGPTLIVNEGDAVTITLFNDSIPSATSLMIAGQSVIPDTSGVTMGSNKTYVIPAGVLNPGTYLYEAGLTADGPRQVAMGLYGALIVRPTGAPFQAYADPSTTFADEAVLVLGEIDPAFNVAPMTYDLNSLAPKYWLINGKTYPNTDPIVTAASDKVLVRYVNAGLQHHSMALLGLHQTIVAADAQPAVHQTTVVAETVPAGGTLDTIIMMPASAPANAKYVLFEAAQHMDNAGALSTPANPNPAYTPITFGGMLTFLTVGGTPVTNAPVTTNVAVTPNLSNGSAPVTLTASVQAFTGTVSSAEYFTDTIGANGSGVPLTGAFGAASVSVNATLSVSQLAAMTSATHTFYVHGQDSTGQWGAAASAVLNLDKTGPTVGNMNLTPSPTNGTADVQLQATASDATTGGQNVQAAEYTIDGGAATAIPIATPTVNVSLNATIISPTVANLAEGSHTVGVRAQDALGNWGTVVTSTLKVDKTGPGATAVSATPNPNNGTLGVQVGTGGGFYVRVDATLSDPSSGGLNSNLVGGEYFIDTVGANGTGGALIAKDGLFNSPTEPAYAAIDLFAINQLGQGAHTVFVRGKDAAGNWGATSTTTLLIDKTTPTFTSITLAPNPTFGAANVTLTVNGAVDTGGAGVAGGEYWINPPTTTAPAPGGGTQFSGLTANIPVGTLATGTYTVSTRIRDAAGNWSTGTNSAVLTVLPDAIFSNGFETGTRPWGWTNASTTNTGRLNVGTPALAGTRSLVAQGNNTNYVQFNFGTAANPTTTTFDARFYFNPNNNASTGQDIFTGGTVNFGATLFHVRYRRSGAQPQVQIQVGATGNAAWVNINNNASNTIEVVWQSGVSLQLYVNGVLSQTLTAGTGSVAAVRLGSVTSGGSNTLEYFDAFVSKRTISPLIGP
jgi:FtsP/CotA-like multicopper oxidase with cupredoxin domain